MYNIYVGCAGCGRGTPPRRKISVNKERSMELPQEYINKIRSLAGLDADAYLASLDDPPVKALRLNREKLVGDLPHMPELTLTPSPLGHDIYFFDGVAGGKNPLHHAGAYYIQEPAAAMPVLSVPTERGMRVLDLCASPGGKTGQLAEAVGADGFVLSNEYSHKRAMTLVGNIERMGFKNCTVSNSSPDRLCPAYAGVFDLVLVDAPCSGEGMFRREPDAVAAWSPESVAGCAKRQSDILDMAAISVAAGGYLVYSTCTLSPEEDEYNVAAFLARHEDFELTKPRVPDGIPGLSPGIPTDGIDAALCRRAYPHLFPGEGQFFAVMRRGAAPVHSAAKPDNRKRGSVRKNAAPGIYPLSGGELATVREFFREFTDAEICGTPVMFKGSVYLLPDRAPTLSLDGLLSPGVRVGSFERDGRLTPHHQFFSAYGNAARIKPDFAPDDARVAKYLHGETMTLEEAGLPSDSVGWGAICVGGVAAGGIRAAGGTVKNHYPKGLRI